MSTGIRPERRKLTPDEYKRVREFYSDDEILAQGYEPPTPGMGRGLVGALAQLGSNWADEMLGAADALGALAHGRGWQVAKERYKTTQQAVESADNDFREKNPKTSLSLSLAGGLVPLGAGAMAAKLPATAAKIALSAPAVGAGMGALTGAGRGADMGERASNAGVGAGVGAAAGAVLGPLAGAAASRFMRSRAGQALAPKALAAADAVTQKVGLPVRARNPFPSPAKSPASPAADKALQYVVKKLADDGVNPATIEEAVSRFEAGSPELLYNIGGENTRAAMRVLQSYTGPSKQMVQSALDEQSVAVPELITQGIEQAIGKPIPNFDARVQELAGEATRTAKPHYDAIAHQVLGDEELQAILSRPSVSKALETARRQSLDRGMATPKWKPEHMPAADETGQAMAKTPKPGQSERGLFLHAKTSRGAVRPVDQVETEGLIDELLRRDKLDVWYHRHANTRKYGPTSAVTVRNREKLFAIREELDRRGVDFDAVEQALKGREAELLAQQESGELDNNVLEALVREPSRAGGQRGGTPIQAQTDTPEPEAFRVSELDAAKKLLDARIEDLKLRISQGQDPSTNQQELLALEDARSALVGYVDRETSGAYAQARGVAKPLIQNREAFREGRSALNQRGDKLAQRVGEMSPEERALMLEGSATDLNERLTSSRDQNAASIFTPKAQRNLGILTKGTPADATIRRTVERASNLQRDVRASTMRGQSTTATTIGGQRDLEEASTAGALEKGLTVADKAIRGSWPSLAADALRAANARYLRGVTEDVATEAAKILTTKLGAGANKKVIADLVRAALVREGMARSIGQGATRASARGASSAVRPSR